MYSVYLTWEVASNHSLMFVEAAEASLPLAILSDLFDVHTIEACMKLFDWLESRSARLTKVRTCI